MADPPPSSGYPIRAVDLSPANEPPVRDERALDLDSDGQLSGPVASAFAEPLVLMVGEGPT